ncbi:YdcF family protein [Falsiroseomonas sp. CW058]|uniref:YdcF family protein n=1 Tax=Falsiroseomonas sp. CW058 TaxID=3388664 RepID=UPI003D31378D
MTPRRALRLAALPLALLLALGGGFAWFLDEAAGTPAEPARRTDAIVVLTGGAERVETGLRLLEAGLAPRLLVSGAARGLTPAELARAHGRDPVALGGRVALGHAAATTTGNAAEAAAFARAHGTASLRVVTAGYHMPRALLEIGRAAPGLVLVPHPVQPAALRDGSIPPRRAWTLLPMEYLKYLAAAAGLSALVPARDPARR